MAAKKQEQQTEESICNNRLCPVHGTQKLKARGRVFEGIVVKKLSDRATIEMERMFKVSKYERYEKRRTKIQARVFPCMKDSFNVGDRIEISETRPISKTINFVVTKVVRRNN